MLRHEDADPARDEHWDALAKAVRDRRRELGIPTQKAAAELAGISQNTWQRLESGKPISLTSLNAVADVLGWPPSLPTAILESGPEVVRAGGSTASHTTPLIGHDLAIMTGSAVVTVLPEDDAPPADQLQAAADTNVVMVPLLVPRDVFNNLDEEDVRWLVHTVMRQGRELASTISDARRIGRIKQQRGCGDT